MLEKGSYTIHDCNPSISWHSKPDQSELMTGDGLFVNDIVPKYYENTLIRPGEELEITDDKKSKRNRPAIPREDIEEGGKKPLSAMDRICRARKCLHEKTCSQVLKILSSAKDQKDIEHAEKVLEDAENKDK